MGHNCEINSIHNVPIDASELTSLFICVRGVFLFTSYYKSGCGHLVIYFVQVEKCGGGGRLHVPILLN